jgi:twitching motility protein PilT
VPLVNSLLTAIVRANGDALVLHAGERPYVVAPAGQLELASRALTLEAVKGMLNELLPVQARQTLDEIGAVQHDLGFPAFAPGQSFSVVAARGGDDIWIEIRRHITAAPPIEEPVDFAVFQPEPEPEPASEPVVPPEPPMQVEPVAEPEPALASMDLNAEAEPAVAAPHAWQPDPQPELEVKLEAQLEPEPEPTPEAELEPELQLAPEPELEPEPMVQPRWSPEAPMAATELLMAGPDANSRGAEWQGLSPALPQAIEFPTAPQLEPPAELQQQPEPELLLESEPQPEPEPELEPEPEPEPEPVRALEPEPRHAVVLPLSRHQFRGEQTARVTPPLNATGIDRLLRMAAARSASTLYVTSQARPSIRVEGGIVPIDGEPVLSETDVETLIVDLIPGRDRDVLRAQMGIEWTCDVPEIGRVRCVTFKDRRGAGGIFRMTAARPITAEQLGLSREIQDLCAESDGLVLVTGARSSGKSTLVSAFVDLINNTRCDHVVTIESQIKFVHENRSALVSQREVQGDRSELLSAARAALRESPDVLVIEDLGSAELVAFALEAAQSGVLVIGAVAAQTAAGAVEHIIDQAPLDQRARVQLGLAEQLRGVVAQSLLRKTAGGRVAAREVLLNTNAVAALIAEGKTSQLSAAIEGGRKHGMVPMNDALVAVVQSGLVDSREAYRQAVDQQGFLELLKRTGVDTSFVERLA